MPPMAWLRYDTIFAKKEIMGAYVCDVNKSYSKKVMEKNVFVLV